jgi:hypothetical protein
MMGKYGTRRAKDQAEVPGKFGKKLPVCPAAPETRLVLGNCRPFFKRYIYVAFLQV